MKQRLLTTVLALLAIVMSVLAQSGIDIWIAGTEITWSSSIASMDQTTGIYTLNPIDGVTGTVRMNPNLSPKVLYLDNVTITNSSTTADHKDGIYVESDIKIVLTGTNTVTSTSGGHGIYIVPSSSSTLSSIEGSGSLTVSGKHGIYCAPPSTAPYEHNLSIKSSVTAEGTAGYGIRGLSRKVTSGTAYFMALSFVGDDILVKAKGTQGAIGIYKTLTLDGPTLQADAQIGEHNITNASGTTIANEWVTLEPKNAINETNFPDAEFRKYVSRRTIDADENGYLSDAEIAAVKNMVDLPSWGIQSLQGIEYFTALNYLNCNYNHLSELDLSQNMALMSVYCSNNSELQQLTLPRTNTLTEVRCNDCQLITLDLTGITNLQTLYCENNALTQLFVNNFTALTTLSCYSNNLQALGITGCSALTDVRANRNQLTALNLEGCSALKFLSIYKNQIKQTAMNNIISQLPTRSGSSPATITLLYTGEGGEGNEYSSQNVEDAEMKYWHVYGFDGTSSQSITADYVSINATNFPDEDFRNYVSTNFDTNGNGALSMQELSVVTDINVYNKSVTDLTGIEYFTALTSLNCGGNASLESFDISKNTLLTSLNCSGNAFLESFDITANTLLENVSCYVCSLTAETISALLYALPASQHTCSITIYKKDPYEKNDISLTAAQVSELNAKNWHVYIMNSDGSSEELTTGVVRISPAYFPDTAFRIYITNIFDANGDLLLTDDEAQDVDEMYINEKGISDLTGLEHFTNLETLWCQDNQLTSLDVSNLSHLSTLYCQNNQLQMLDVTGTDLYTLQCYGNQIKGDFMQLLINSLPADRTQDAILTAYNTAGDEGNDRPTSAQISTARSKGWMVYTTDGSNTDQLQPLNSVQINSMNFPDENFRAIVSNYYDDDADGFLSAEEIESVTKIGVETHYQEIGSMKGIELFPYLTELTCYGNNMTELDLSKNTRLTFLDCHSNDLTNLNLSGCTELTYINCSWNDLFSINVSSCTKLAELKCYDNQLLNLDLSNNTALTHLWCDNNSLIELDLSNNTALEELYCSYNQLSTLDLSHNTALKMVSCEVNNINHEGTDAMMSNLPTVTDGTLRFYSTSVIEGYTEGNWTNAEQVLVARQKGWTVKMMNIYWYSILNIVPGNVAINETTFPDDNFRAFVSDTYDTDQDDYLSNAEAYNIREIDVSGRNIADLTGLGYFPSLRTIDCHNNLLTHLDLSYFPNLTRVDCYLNRLEGTAMDDVLNSLIKKLSTRGTIVPYCTGSGEQNSEPTAQQVDDANQKLWDVYSYDGNSYTTVTVSEIAINETNFPDDNFRAYVRNWFDKDNNVSLSNEEIQKVKYLYVEESEIGDLKGIEYFTALTSLDCFLNNLTALDLSQNTALTYLNCLGNNLTALDLSQNTALTYLDCYGNNLTALDLSQNKALTTLDCAANNLTALDLSQNTALTNLDCAANNLTALDVSQNTALTYLGCGYNNLTVLDVSKNLAIKTIDCHINSLTTLDLSKNKLLARLDCFRNNISGSGMQALVESLPTVTNGTLIPVYNDSPTEQNHMTTEQADLATSKGWQVKTVGNEDFQELFTIDDATFPDENFRNYVSENFDTDHDGKLTRLEADAVEVINVREMNINDLTGIACFSQLKELYCMNDFDETGTENHIVTLDLSGNPELTYVGCGQNGTLESLNITNCTKLENLHCASNNLSSLDVTHNPKLWRIYCRDNQLTALNLAGNPLLKELQCSENQLSALDVSNHTALDNLSFYQNPLTSLDVSGCTALWYLNINDVPLTTVDLSNIPTLRNLSIYNTQLPSIDLSHNTALTSLYVAYNSKLSSIDLQYNTALDSLWFYQNEYTTFPDLTNNKALTLLYYDSNSVATEFNLSDFPLLKIAQISNSQLTSLNITNCPALEKLYCYSNQLTTLDVSGCTALTDLVCGNNQLSSLDVSGCTNLTYIRCSDNQLSSLDVSKNTALTQLTCNNNQLTTINMSQNTALKYLDCDKNQLSALDLSQNKALKYLWCSFSQISSLIVSPEAENLEYIECFVNQLRGGKAVDDLIESLPDLTSANQWGVIWFRELDNQYEEHNFCSPDQAIAAYNKGWTFREWSVDDWNYYWGTTSLTGDANGDGVVNIDDVLAVVNYILGLSPANFNSDSADYNGDSSVTIADVAAIVDYILASNTSSKSRASTVRTMPNPRQLKGKAADKATPSSSSYILLPEHKGAKSIK